MLQSNYIFGCTSSVKIFGKSPLESWLWFACGMDWNGMHLSAAGKADQKERLAAKGVAWSRSKCHEATSLGSSHASPAAFTSFPRRSHLRRILNEVLRPSPPLLGSCDPQLLGSWVRSPRLRASLWLAQRKLPFSGVHWYGLGCGCGWGRGCNCGCNGVGVRVGSW